MAGLLASFKGVRIAVYLQGTPPSEGGGFTFQEEMLSALRRQASASDHEWVVFSWGEVPSSPKVQCVRYRRGLLVQAWTRIARALNRAQELWLGAPKYYFRSAFDRDLVKHRIDWVWFVSPADLPCELPFTYTMWDLQHAYQPWFPEVSAAGEWEVRENRYRGLFPKASRVIVPNATAARELKNWYRVPDNRIACLPHPTPSWALEAKPLSKADAASQVREWYGVEGRFVYYPAQLWAHKNHATLIRACKLLKDRGSPVHFVFSGSDRGNRPFLEAEANALGVTDLIHWVGFVPSDRMPALYRGSEALVFASLFGPENLPPLEASALGVRVLLSEVHGGRDQFSAGVTWVEGLNPAAWADAISNVLSETVEVRELLVDQAKTRAKSWRYDDYVRMVTEDFDKISTLRSLWGSSS
jgi:glycosyltransferase involved in cell wall biosynthesis